MRYKIEWLGDSRHLSVLDKSKNVQTVVEWDGSHRYPDFHYVSSFLKVEGWRLNWILTGMVKRRLAEQKREKVRNCWTPVDPPAPSPTSEIPTARIVRR